MNFKAEIDNEEEECLTDDDLIDEIKQYKCKQQIKRCDILYEQFALENVIEGSK
jgi:hypothetical protein